jgi:hypothetical protein
MTEVGEVNDFKFETQTYKRELIVKKMAGYPAIFMFCRKINNLQPCGGTRKYQLQLTNQRHTTE